MDSNQRMTGSKPVALPLGYTPMDLFTKDIKYPKERYKTYLSQTVLVIVLITHSKMAGVDGLEPTNDGIKTRCLTTWLYPNNGAEGETRTLTP
jgi:hypothetical protein